MIKNYVSLFSGIGGIEYGLHKVFPEVDCLNYSEIDIYAEQTFLKNFPQYEGKNLGNIEQFCLTFQQSGNYTVNEARIKAMPDFDLLIGGSPCQDLSVQKGKDRQGLKGLKSRLFFCYLEILRIKRPKFFLLENVATMLNSDRDAMTALISEAYQQKIEPVLINSALLSPQNRSRYYWANWPIEQPIDSKVILERNGIPVHAWSKSVRSDGSMDERIRVNGKANTIVCSSDSTESINFFPDSSDFVFHPRKIHKREDLFCYQIRPDQKLTINEMEFLQMLPKDYTKGQIQSKRIKQIGNAVTVTVIEHIFNELKRGQK